MPTSERVLDPVPLAAPARRPSRSGWLDAPDNPRALTLSEPSRDDSEMQALRLALSRFALSTTIGELGAMATDIARSVTGGLRTELYLCDDDNTVRQRAESARGIAGPVDGPPIEASAWPDGLLQRLGHGRVLCVPVDEASTENPVSECLALALPTEDRGTGQRAVFDHYAALGARHVVMAALVYQERMIGFIVCLCRGRRPIANRFVQMLETLAGMASLQLSALRHRDVLERDRRARASLVGLMAQLQTMRPSPETLRKLGGDLMEMVQAHGVAHVEDGAVAALGATPSASDLRHLVGDLYKDLLDGPVTRSQVGLAWCGQDPGGLTQPDEDADGQGDGDRQANGHLGVLAVWIQPGTVLLWFRLPKPGLGTPEPWRDIDTDCARRIAQLWDTLTAHDRLNRTQERLRDETARLTQSNNELERFAYIASHDLREPLRMVTSYCRLLEKRYAEDLDSDARDIIAFAVEGAQRMDRLVSGLVLYSRVMTHGASFQSVDLGTVLSRVLRDMSVRIAEAKATISEGPLPSVLADKDQMALMLHHLLANALTYVAPGERPKITISGQAYPTHVDVFVDDEGIGIQPDFSERIFDLFQRLHTRECYPGSGLGLAICRRIAQRHGGSIHVCPKAQGTRFVVRLPTSPAMLDQNHR